MKKIYLIALFILPFTLLSQIPSDPIKPVRIGLQPKMLNDTIVEKDSTDSRHEYLKIKNVKNIIVSQGEMYDGKKNGLWRDYSNYGALMRAEEYKTGVRNGASLSFSQAGQIQQDATYRIDSLDGQRIIFLSNGHPKSIENYSNGKLNGERKSFYDDSKLQEESVYKDGLRNGFCRWFLQNGKPSLEYNYVNGSLEGPAKEYNQAGIIQREGSYKNNEEDGEWKEYQDSVPVKKIIYKNGIVVKEIKIKK